MSKVAKDNPGVYVKSMAKPFHPEKRMPITVSLTGSDQGEVEAAIDKALGELRRALTDGGFSIVSVT